MMLSAISCVAFLAITVSSQGGGYLVAPNQPYENQIASDKGLIGCGTGGAVTGTTGVDTNYRHYFQLDFQMNAGNIVAFSSCNGTAFDTGISLWEWDPNQPFHNASMTMVGSNDDATGCAGRSRFTIDASVTINANKCYLAMVGDGDKGMSALGSLYTLRMGCGDPTGVNGWTTLCRTPSPTGHPIVPTPFPTSITLNPTVITQNPTVFTANPSSSPSTARPTTGSPVSPPPTFSPTRLPSAATLSPTFSPTTPRPTNSSVTGYPTLSPTDSTLSPSGSPTTGQPTTGSPVSFSPTLGPTKAPSSATLSPSKSPTTGAPTTGSPTTKRPTTSRPTTSRPTTGLPTTAPPTTALPTTGSPTTGSPTMNPTISPSFATNTPTMTPTTGRPTTNQPTTLSPVTNPPTTGSPTTGSPITASPVTNSPTTDSPITASPITLSPVTNSPTTSSPTDPCIAIRANLSPCTQRFCARNKADTQCILPDDPLVASLVDPMGCFATASPCGVVTCQQCGDLTACRQRCTMMEDLFVQPLNCRQNCRSANGARLICLANCNFGDAQCQ